MSKTETLSVHIDPKLRADLAAIAKREDRSISSIVELAIRDRIAFDREQKRGIERAIEQADQGDVVPHGAVREWVESWGTDFELPMPEPKSPS